MDKYTVTGMSCAACQARVEKAVSKVPGVTSCSVSLLTNSMGVEGTAGAADIIRAVEDAGYGASLQGGAKTGGEKGIIAQQEEALRDTETPKLKKRLIISVAVLVFLMYFSMGHMFGWPVPGFLTNVVALALWEMLLALVILVINGKFFTSGYSSLFHGSPNMDTLVALGSTAAFGYSLVELFLMIIAQGNGDTATVNMYGMDLYFEASAMIPTLITVGKLLEALSKGRTTDALKALMHLAPKTAVVVRQDAEGKEAETEIPVEQVSSGDIFVVRPGAAVPVDGVVLEGQSAVNEAALTGESIPVDKQPGDTVTSATMNQSGFLRCRATRVGEDTTLSQIIQMVSDAAATKAPLARIADKVSGIFVPAVMGIALVTCIGWLIAGQTFGFAIARAISVLVISCPCALGLATPVAIMVGNGMGAKNGILYKTAQSLEETGRVQIVALDKTGTITLGEPKVTDIRPVKGITEMELLSVANALEQKSEHPLAQAIVEYAQGKDLLTGELDEFQALPGNGLMGRMEGVDMYGGNRTFIETVAGMDEGLLREAGELAGQGKTPLFFAAAGKLLGFIAVADVIKEDSPAAVKELHRMGIHTVMLTGDNVRTAEAVSRQAGVDEVVAGVQPGEKQTVVRRLQKYGKVAMVGDGINDAPALTAADVGIAIGTGADVAVDAADVVVMKSRLTDVAAAIRMSRATIRNIHENLFWAFFYNIICIPLAMGLYGIAMNPMIGAACMSLSSFCVCMNALRLNRVKMYDGSRDRALKNSVAGTLLAEEPEDEFASVVTPPEKVVPMDRKEKPAMKKTMNIEGMMCEHCEATVKKALESLDGVDNATVSHEKGTAVVEMSRDVDDAALTKAVEDKDYKVVSVA